MELRNKLGGRIGMLRLLRNVTFFREMIYQILVHTVRSIGIGCYDALMNYDVTFCVTLVFPSDFSENVGV